MRRVALARRPYRMKKVAISRRSKKREAAYAGPEGRRAFVKAFLAEWQICMIDKVCEENSSILFAGLAVDVHEKIPRSAMGAIVPGEKATEQGQVFYAVCRQCHSYIHDNPKWAKEKGWLQ